MILTKLDPECTNEIIKDEAKMNIELFLETLQNEREFDEGSAFVIKAMKAASRGEPTFKIGGKTYKTKASREKGKKFFKNQNEAEGCSCEGGQHDVNEAGCSMNEAKKSKKYYGPRQYRARVGSPRAKELKKAADLYKQGDIEAAAAIRKNMEKKKREEPSFRPRKSQYTDKNENEMKMSESILDELLDEVIKEALKDSSTIEEAKRKKKRTHGGKKKSSSETALKNKAEDRNAPLGALRTVYEKGLGAYVSSGSRPGMTAQQWAMARVNSFLSGGKARKVDAAQWKQVQKFRKRSKKK